MKKKLALVLAAVLILTSLISGTLAYLTDTDKADNVFAVGDVDVMLRENGSIGGTQYADHDYREQLDLQNVTPGTTVDKNVWIDNVDNEAAYVRVIMSVDKDLTPAWAEGYDQTWNHSNVDYGDHWIHVFETKAPVAANSSTGNILDGFTMNATVDEVSIDNSYNIPITVYAIQATGFDATSAYTQLNTEFPKAMPVLVTSAEELTAAIAAVEDGVPTEISLADGTYALGQNPFKLKNKDITFRGSEKAVIDLTGWSGPMASGSAQNASITFDGLTVKWAEYNTKYQGFTSFDKVTYKNCTITGTQAVDGNADFINCVFDAEDTSEHAYAIYTRNTGTVTLTDCTMYTDGRAIMMYSDISCDMKVVLNNCSFYDNGVYASQLGKEAKAVVETGTKSGYNVTFDITINECTAYGFGEVNSTSPLWGNKNSAGTNILNVVINGQDVY